MDILKSIQQVLEALSNVWRPNGDGTYSRLPDSDSHKTIFKKLPNLGIEKVIRGITTASGNQAHRATDSYGRSITERPHGGYSSNSGNKPKFGS